MRRLFSGLLGNTQDQDTALVEQTYFIGIYSFIGFIAFFAFGLQYILNNDMPEVGYLELFFSLCFAINAIAVTRTKRIGLAKTAMLIITFIFLMVMLTSGGIEFTGLLWFFVFPIIAFFLTNAKDGALWMLLLFAFTIALWQLPDSVLSLPYTDIVMRQMLVCLFVVTLGVFFYQVNRDRAFRRERATERAKSEFLTLASHQLRTPISAIGWLGEILLSDDAGRLTTEQRDHIKHIYDSNQRLASIVDAMLIVSGLEVGQLEVRREVVDLPDVAHKALTDQIDLHPGKELHITEKYDDKLAKLRLDLRLTKIILQNVFSNAVKYTPKGGSIVVAIARSGERLHSKSKGSVLITVTDTGYGIAEGDQKAVFSKMFRAENIKSKDTDGTGLGLFIVKEVLQEVGGKIWFTSTEGKGSTFSILLPLEGMKHQMEKRNR